MVPNWTELMSTTPASASASRAAVDSSTCPSATSIASARPALSPALWASMAVSRTLFTAPTTPPSGGTCPFSATTGFLISSSLASLSPWRVCCCSGVKPSSPSSPLSLRSCINWSSTAFIASFSATACCLRFASSACCSAVNSPFSASWPFSWSSFL